MKSSASVATPSPTPAKTIPSVQKSTSKNSRSIKLEEKDRKEEKSDDTINVYELHESEMKMEISPKKLIVSPDTPLQVSMKCLAKDTQELIVQLDSFLFVILNPRAFRGTKSQIYCLMEPGETLNFQIGMMKETGPGVHESDLPAIKKPEGELTVFHQITSKVDDTDKRWVGFARCIYDDRSLTDEVIPEYSKTVPEYSKKYEELNENRRIVKINVDEYREHGISYQEMFLEKETVVTEKRRIQFKEILVKEAARVEREKKKKEEEAKKKKKAKKCCKCTIL